MAQVIFTQKSKSCDRQMTLDTVKKTVSVKDRGFEQVFSITPEFKDFLIEVIGT